MVGGRAAHAGNAVDAAVLLGVGPVVADIIVQVGVFIGDVVGQVGPGAFRRILFPHTVVQADDVGHIAVGDVERQLLGEVAAVAFSEVEIDADFVLDVFAGKVGRLVHGAGSGIEHVEHNGFFGQRGQRGRRQHQSQSQNQGKDLLHGEFLLFYFYTAFAV